MKIFNKLFKVNAGTPTGWNDPQNIQLHVACEHLLQIAQAAPELAKVQKSIKNGTTITAQNSLIAAIVHYFGLDVPRSRTRALIQLELASKLHRYDSILMYALMEYLGDSLPLERRKAGLKFDPVLEIRTPFYATDPTFSNSAGII